MNESPAPFIVGVSRSGTTLLRLMLDAHPDLAIPFETHFVHKLAARQHENISADEFFQIVTGAPPWPNMGLDASQLREALAVFEPFRAQDGLRAFYRLCAARFGKRRWGDKTPHYLNSMVGIQKLLPEAHFIHIIRDGRDTALSFRGLWFGPGADVATAAEFWSNEVNRARLESARLRHYLEVRYEDLVLDPAGVLTRIMDYLAMPFDQSMLEYYRTASDRLADIIQPFGPNGGNELDIESFAAIHSNTRKPPDPGRIARWRREMSDDDQRRFEGIAGPLLSDLGYETRF